MNETNDNQQMIDDSIRQELGALADQAGPGPTAGQVYSHRYRRRGQRAVKACSVLLLIGLAGLLVRLGVGPVRPDRTGSTGQVVLQTEPLPIGADQAQVIRQIEQFVVRLRAGSLLTIEKTPGDGISYAISGRLAVEPAVLDSAVARLLEHYPMAKIEWTNGKLSYHLISEASSRSASPRG